MARSSWKRWFGWRTTSGMGGGVCQEPTSRDRHLLLRRPTVAWPIAGGEVEWAAGVGLGGQMLFVVPSLDLIVVTKAGPYTSRLPGSPTIDVPNDYVLTAVHAN